MVGKLKRIFCFFFVLLSLFAFAGCGEVPEAPCARTLFMYFPWSGGLVQAFRTNISDMEKAVAAAGLDGQRVVVFLAESETEASMFELSYSNGRSSRAVLKNYSGQPAVGEVLADVKLLCPSVRYGMTIGSHGMGWIPAGQPEEERRSCRKPGGGGMQTRWFGGTAVENRIDVSALASGIEDLGVRFDFIVFDGCYMSSVEAAFELRGVTDYIVASPCEIMMPGLPYEKIGGHLLGNADLRSVCDGFLNYYSAGSYPYGTLAVVDCRELDALAAVMKKVNEVSGTDGFCEDAVQKLDCYAPAVFFDLGDYVGHLCKSPELLDAFRQQLSRTAVYEVHTDCYYTETSGVAPLSVCSGISVSDPSRNAMASRKGGTAWWAATH